ncbi:MAG: hypothetical protein JSU01_20135 [Bacteroidetes bacterium]|nr:hypothetical protein [Bacteroidota bacterium]
MSIDRGGAGPVFKRRHFGNPQVFNVIVTNYVVVFFGLMLFVNSKHHIHWFFWVVMGVLAAYNVFMIYRHRDEITLVSIIAYIIGLAGLPLIFLMV